MRSLSPRLGAIAVFAAFQLAATAQSPNSQPRKPAPAELVRQAVNNEVASADDSGRRFMFHDERKTPHLWQTKLIVESRDATAGMLIGQDGRSLTPQERKAEEARLDNYVRNPEELERKRKQEKEDADRTGRILKALPDAFLFEPDGTEPGTASVGRSGDQLVRFKFRPNPNYDPPTRVEQVLTGMAGTLLVDANEKRIAEIDGTLQKDVGFGWGILGHLDRGGRFLVQQADIGKRQWELTRMELAFSGKILFFKKLDIRSSDVFSEFREVRPDLTFAQAVDLLKREADKLMPEAGDHDALKRVPLPNSSLCCAQ